MNSLKEPWPVQVYDRLFRGGRPLVASIPISTFFGTTVFAILNSVFKWSAQIEKYGQVIPVFWIVYNVICCLAIRSVFLVSERLVGALEELEVERRKVAVFEQVHAVIHQTRDELLRDGRITQLPKLTLEARQRLLYRIVEVQLAHLAKAMDNVSGKKCVVCLKVVRPGGLETACYSPGAPLERRQSTTKLPVNQGLAGRCVVTKSICHTNDVSADETFFPCELREAFSKRYRTVVACPIITHGRCVAVLCFDWKEPRMYKSEYRELLACFTDSISTAFYLCVSHEHAELEFKVHENDPSQISGHAVG